MFQVADLDKPGAVDALAKTDYPMIVVEPGDDLEPPFDTASMLQKLSRRPSGQRRLVLAYVDVGEASDERGYWKSYWTAPTENFHGYPDFLLRLSEPRDGLYPVAFWSESWRRLWLGPEGRLAKLARMGFDGVVLDGVESFEDPSVRLAAQRAGLEPGPEMIAFLAQARAAGRKVTPDFLALAENGAYLIDEDPLGYASAVDGLVTESTFFAGLEGSAWESSTSGDQPFDDADGAGPLRRLYQLDHFLSRGLPVFSVDYCVEPQNAAVVYDQASRYGLRPLVTRYPLSRLTETPPASNSR
jgi:cysteinyl-tRNA synthetase